MGKAEEESGGANDLGNGICGLVFFGRFYWEIAQIRNAVSAKCVLFLILGVSVFLSAIFWIPPLRSKDLNSSEGFSASIQASFILQKPISVVSSYSPQLEYDIFEEIGVPDTKVSVIDLQPLTSESTCVVFGIVPNPQDAILSPIVLSVLRSSLTELVLTQLNLSLTTSIFGCVSSFEVLKFPGGITVIPVQSASIWQMSPVLFNFTLSNSISQIWKNVDQLKDQLKFGLNLRSYENVYIQMTNHNGSTVDAPVIVQAAVLSDVGSRNLLPPRLKQLAQKITTSPKNLGLNHTVFGKVNEVQLSSYLNNSITFLDHPSPSPSPGPSLSPSQAPALAVIPAPAHSHQRPARPPRPPRRQREPRSGPSPAPKIASSPSQQQEASPLPPESEFSPPPSTLVNQENKKFGRTNDSSSLSDMGVGGASVHCLDPIKADVNLEGFMAEFSVNRSSGIIDDRTIQFSPEGIGALLSDLRQDIFTGSLAAIKPGSDSR